MSTPLNVPVTPSPAGTWPRSVTGTLAGPPLTGLAGPAAPVANTTDPLESPAPAGTRADTRTTRDAPGARLNFDGETLPNGTADDTDAPNRTVPAVPPALAVSLKITAVQLPAAGRRTCALPYPLTPCGSESAASLPAGSTRMTRTLAFGSLAAEALAAEALAGQAIDAFSTAAPRGTLKVTDPELAGTPAQLVKCGLLASDSVTVAFVIAEAPPRPRPLAVTVLAVQAVLVTVTGHDAAAPGLPV